MILSIYWEHAFTMYEPEYIISCMSISYSQSLFHRIKTEWKRHLLWKFSVDNDTFTKFENEIETTSGVVFQIGKERKPNSIQNVFIFVSLINRMRKQRCGKTDIFFFFFPLEKCITWNTGIFPLYSQWIFAIE